MKYLVYLFLIFFLPDVLVLENQNSFIPKGERKSFYVYLLAYCHLKVKHRELSLSLSLLNSGLFSLVEPWWMDGRCYQQVGINFYAGILFPRSKEPSGYQFCVIMLLRNVAGWKLVWLHPWHLWRIYCIGGSPSLWNSLYVQVKWSYWWECQFLSKLLTFCCVANGRNYLSQK